MISVDDRSGAKAIQEIMELGLNVMPSFDMSGTEPCRLDTADPEAWHPAVGEDVEQYREARYARKQCELCPREPKTQCLLWALEYSPQGVWGGTTLREREMLQTVLAGTESSVGLQVITEGVFDRQDRQALDEAERAAVLNAPSKFKRRVTDKTRNETVSEVVTLKRRVTDVAAN